MAAWLSWNPPTVHSHLHLREHGMADYGKILPQAIAARGFQGANKAIDEVQDEPCGTMTEVPS